MKLRHLQAMRAVVAGRTITRAAEILGITQPAMSRIISGLESETGLKLFTRRGNQLILTGNGQTFFLAAEQVFEATDNLLEVADKIRTGNYGMLRLVLQSAFEVGLLPRVLAGFSKSHPSISVLWEIRPRKDMDAWLASGQFDLGFARMPVDYPTSRIEKFATLEACVVAPIGHPLSRRRVITPKDLDGQTLISIARGTLLRYRIDEMLGNANIRFRNIEAHMTSAAYELVAAGAGVAILHGLAKFAQDDRVMAVPFAPETTFDYAIIWPANNAPTGPAQAFADYLKSYVSANIG